MKSSAFTFLPWTGEFCSRSSFPLSSGSCSWFRLRSTDFGKHRCRRRGTPRRHIYVVSEVGADSIGFIGSGQMANALIRGLMASATRPKIFATASSVSSPNLKSLQLAGASPSSSNAQLMSDAELVVLCVKPQFMSGVLSEISEHVERRHLLVSVAAGVSTATIEAALPQYARVARGMPNLAAIVGESATAICSGSNATAADAAAVHRLFSLVGAVYPLPERLFNAVTALSGSGPAFVAIMIESLADGGVASGLPRDVAMALAKKTVAGTAALLQSSSMHPAALKDSVASPAGTTIAGLRALERLAFRSAVIEAVVAAAERGTQLG